MKLFYYNKNNNTSNIIVYTRNLVLYKFIYKTQLKRLFLKLIELNNKKYSRYLKIKM